MATLSRRFKLVVAVDASDDADAVVEYALDQASRHQRPDVHVVTVVGAGDEAAAARAKQRLITLVGGKLEVFAPDGAQQGSERQWHVRGHVRRGDAAEEILELAREVEAHLVVIGGSSSGGRKPHVGKIAAKVIAAAPCPVMAVRVAELQSHELAIKQCPACVAIREESFGERWFCKEHARPYFGTSTLLLPTGGAVSRGGLMW